MVSHWSDKYIGEPYVPDSGDCAALAARVQAEQFNHDVGLPLAHASHVRSQAAQIFELKDELASKIEKPVEGCAVLLIARGVACHIGVMCWLVSEWWVLHADQQVGFVVRQRLRDLTKIRYQLEGFYAWK